MAVIVKDTFIKESNDITLNPAATGQSWAVLLGGYAIDAYGGVAYSTSTPALALVDSKVSDCIITVSVNAIDTTGIMLRQKQGTVIDGLRVELRSGSMQLVQYPAGTIIATQSMTNIQEDSTLKVEMQGTSIKAYKNDVLVLSATSSYNQTETRHGFYTSRGWTNFSNFLITTIGETKIGEYRMAGTVLPIYAINTMPTVNQLRTMHPTKGIGCFELVPLSDPKASRIYFNAKGTIKAIKKE